MTTARKITPYDKARAKVAELDEQEQAARGHRDDARAYLAELQNRIHAGDPTVTGLALMTARADVEAAEGLADHAARMLADAQADAAALLAEKTAHEVRESITLHDIAQATREAQKAVTAALRGLHDALLRRDAASDAAGQALSDAGVPAGEWINGIRYLPVHSLMGGLGRRLPGQFNVEVQTEDGLQTWLSSAGSERNTRHTSTRLVDDVIDAARASLLDP